MELKVFTPAEVVLECEVEHVTAEDVTGSLGMRTGHASMVTPLVRGIVIARAPDGVERYVAVDRGVLMVANDLVQVVSRQAIAGDDLAELERTALARFEQEEDKDRANHVAFEKLRLSFMRGVLELEMAGETL